MDELEWLSIDSDRWLVRHPKTRAVIAVLDRDGTGKPYLVRAISGVAVYETASFNDAVSYISKRWGQEAGAKNG